MIFPGELNGNIPSSNYYDHYHGKNHWTSMAIISLGIGQGEIGITPLQMANLAALISNHGFFYTPHIIKAIGKRDNLNKEFSEKHYCKVDPQYFPVVIGGMHDVMQAGGTGAESHVEGIEIVARRALHKIHMVKIIPFSSHLPQRIIPSSQLPLLLKMQALELLMQLLWHR